MPRTGPATRIVTLRLFDEDVEELKRFYPYVGYNRVVRALVRRHIRALRDRTADKLAASGAAPDVELQTEEGAPRDA